MDVWWNVIDELDDDQNALAACARVADRQARERRVAEGQVVRESVHDRLLFADTGSVRDHVCRQDGNAQDAFCDRDRVDVRRGA